MANPITQAQLDSMKTFKVTGAVSSEQMANLGRELYFLHEWMTYLSQFNFSGLPTTAGGPATTPPPPPPAWPP